MIIKVFIFAFLIYISIHVGAYVRNKGYSEGFSYFMVALSFLLSPLVTFIIAFFLPELDE